MRAETPTLAHLVSLQHRIEHIRRSIRSVQKENGQFPRAGHSRDTHFTPIKTTSQAFCTQQATKRTFFGQIQEIHYISLYTILFIMYVNMHMHIYIYLLIFFLTFLLQINTKIHS